MSLIYLSTVNRQELRCRPTEIRDGKRRVVDEENEDPLEETLNEDDDDDGENHDKTLLFFIWRAFFQMCVPVMGTVIPAPVT